MATQREAVLSSGHSEPGRRPGGRGKTLSGGHGQVAGAPGPDGKGVLLGN